MVCRRAQRRLRDLAAAAAVTLGLLGADGPPAARAAAPPLRGVTTLEAERTGFTLVDLPRALTVFSEDPAQTERRLRVNVEGPGRIRGIGLRATTPAADGSTPTLLAFSDAGGTFTSSSTGELPAGTYRLYGLMDQGAVRAQLKSPELTGETTLRVDTATPAVAGPLPARTAQTANLVVAGRSETLSSDGFVYLDLRVRHPQAAGRMELCVYPEGDGGAADAYDVNCPGGQSTYLPTSDTQPPGESSLSFLSRRGAGPYGVGGNFQFAPFPPEVDGLAGWFSFEPAGTAPSPLAPPPPAPVAPADGGIAVVATRAAKTRRGVLRLRAHCPGAHPCSGSARLLARGRARRFRIAPGRAAPLRLALDRRDRARLRRASRIRVTVRLQGRDAAGLPYSRETRITARR